MWTLVFKQYFDIILMEASLNGDKSKRNDLSEMKCFFCLTDAIILIEYSKCI